MSPNSERVNVLSACNDPPLGLERRELSNLLHSCQQYGANLDERMALVQATLNTLQKEKQEVDALKAKLKTALHPIRTVPNEVLGEIFSALVEASPAPSFQDLQDGNFVDSLNMKSPVWVVSQVSSRWRQTALAASRLWTRVSLSFQTGNFNSFSTVFLLTTYLSRSGNQPLHVDLCGNNDISNHRAMPSLLFSCPRWEDAKFSLSLEAYTLFNHIPAQFSLLKSVQLHLMVPIEADIFISSSRGSIKALKEAPALQYITVDNPGVFEFLFDVKWQNVLHFHHFGRRGSNRVPWAILKQARHLQCASFNVVDLLPGIEPSSEHRDLRFLSLKGASNAIIKCLSNMLLPNLESLSVHFPKDVLDRPFIHPSAMATSLRHLTVSLRHADARETGTLSAMLRAANNVTHLKIHLIEVDNLTAVANMLQPTTTKVSQLQALAFIGLRGFRLTPELNLMIAVRRTGENGVAVLKKIMINYLTGSEVGVAKVLQDFARQGLDVHLTLDKDS